MNNSCSNEIPRAVDLFSEIKISGLISLLATIAIASCVIVVFLESVLHLYKQQEKRNRQFVLTLWMFSIYPVFAVSGVWSLIIPRSGTLVDFVANVYFSVCIYQFVQLMITYAGGKERILGTLQHVTLFSLRNPPCCCCCLCLPDVVLDSRKWTRLLICVMQTVILRPSLMFIAAVLWTDQSYMPGVISASNAYIYITLLDVTSSLIALYGLLLLQKILMPLLQTHNIRGKFFSLQLVLILNSITNLIIGLLVNFGVIPCGKLLPSKARGQVIYHYSLIIYMLPLSLFARKLYRNGDGFQLKIYNPSDDSIAISDDVEQDTAVGEREENTIINENTISNLIV